MGFNADLKEAAKYLLFEERFLDPKLPQGIWFCDNTIEVADVALNAVCLSPDAEWADVAKCQKFFEHFPYVVIATPNAIAREIIVRELPSKLPACCIYVVQDSGFRGCKSFLEYKSQFGSDQLPNILSGAEELPSFGLLNLADVSSRDLTKVPRTLSGLDRLDKSIGGFFAGEVSIWTGKRGTGKSTLLSQILLEAVDQGHTVCAYSGELDKAQFREWTYLQAAGPACIYTRNDPLTGKKLPTVNGNSEKMISEWLDGKFWLFDLERNTKHDPEAILKQFAYAKMRYNADVFLLDNIMSVDFTYQRSADFNRVQSEFVGAVVAFAKRNHVHVHLVVHPRKSTSDKNSDKTSDDVSGSGDITNRVDNVFFLTTHASTDEKGQPDIKPMLMTLKNRDFGSRIHQWLDFDKKSRRFFPDGKTGNADKKYSWDPDVRQITFTELSDDEPTPFDAEAPLPC